MNQKTLKEWILTLSAAATMISVGVSTIIGVGQYKLTQTAEERLAGSQKAELDIQLIQAFGELMDVANGRSGYILSPDVVKHLLEDDLIKNSDIITFSKVNSLIRDASVMRLPVGSARQEAAITSIYILAKEHDILRVVGIKALEELENEDIRKELVNEYIEELKALQIDKSRLDELAN